jgi:hypothetical protein
MEITGTNIPLLSTVLAGFAVTIIIELINDNKYYRDISFLCTKNGLSLIAISIPLFLSSAVYATYGQSYNFLILTKDVKELMRFTDDLLCTSSEKWQEYLNTLYTIWQYWHRTSIAIYYAGMIFFIVGINIIFLIYIGLVVAVLIIVIIFFAIYFGFVLEQITSKIIHQGSNREILDAKEDPQQS